VSHVPGRMCELRGDAPTVARSDHETQCSQTGLQPARPTLPGEYQRVGFIVLYSYFHANLSFWAPPPALAWPPSAW
jgi:hypothetical protein